jgi:hypothetical protein
VYPRPQVGPEPFVEINAAKSKRHRLLTLNLQLFARVFAESSTTTATHRRHFFVFTQRPPNDLWLEAPQ